MSTNDGGPAFPHKATLTTAYGELSAARLSEFTLSGGMTLRDYFAGQALAGILADSRSSGSYASFAKSAYRYADEMLIARKGRNEPT